MIDATHGCFDLESVFMTRLQNAAKPTGVRETAGNAWHGMAWHS